MDIINSIMKKLPSIPRSYDTSDDPGFWSDGKMILCPSEAECEMLAEFFRDVLSETENVEVITGLFDPL